MIASMFCADQSIKYSLLAIELLAFSVIILIDVYFCLGASIVIKFRQQI